MLNNSFVISTLYIEWKRERRRKKQTHSRHTLFHTNTNKFSVGICTYSLLSWNFNSTNTSANGRNYVQNRNNFSLRFFLFCFCCSVFLSRFLSVCECVSIGVKKNCSLSILFSFLRTLQTHCQNKFVLLQIWSSIRFPRSCFSIVEYPNDARTRTLSIPVKSQQSNVENKTLIVAKLTIIWSFSGH